MFFINKTHYKLKWNRRFWRSSIWLLLLRQEAVTVEPCSTVQWTVEPCSTAQCEWIKIHSHCSFKLKSVFFLQKTRKSLVFFFFEKPGKVKWFYSHYSCEREQYFFLFFLKISLRWIKFTRTVISILFLIIF